MYFFSILSFINHFFIMASTLSNTWIISVVNVVLNLHNRLCLYFLTAYITNFINIKNTWDTKPYSICLSLRQVRHWLFLKFTWYSCGTSTIALSQVWPLWNLATAYDTSASLGDSIKLIILSNSPFNFIYYFV